MGESDSGAATLGKGLLVCLTVAVGVFLTIAMAIPVQEFDNLPQTESAALYAINFILYIPVGLLTICGVIAGNRFALFGAALLSFVVFCLLCAEVHYQLNPTDAIDGYKFINDFAAANAVDCQQFEDYGLDEGAAKCRTVLAFRFLAIFGLLVTMPLNVFIGMKV